MDKSTLADKEVLDQICPNLNILQIKTLIEMFKPDK
jgi:hypothetical protein